jgi:hypothetical protein
MNEKAVKAYANLLKEIKYRIEAIDTALAGKSGMRAKIAEEFCYLQFRMICEIMAIGCLIIHGDISIRGGLLTSYKADWIVKELGKLHPRFFPTPLENQDDMSGKIGAMVARKSGFLTQSDLALLWRRSGERLHRGSARNVLAGDKAIDLKSIGGWRDKIVYLLNRHTLTSADELTMCYFVMQLEGSGEVGWNIFEAIDGSPTMP